jgi:8-oxo-dGTP pyrophosphatase MutT (NUDIX family)
MTSGNTVPAGESPVGDDLSRVLQDTLPGERSHRRMLPTGRLYRSVHDAPPSVRTGAVLIFIGNSRTLTVPFIRRSDDGGPHSGQIALPGGGAEEGDADSVGTALREAREEIGLSPGKVRVVGELSPLFIDVSNYLITPVVATYTEPDPFPWEVLSPHHLEVAEILPIPLCDLESSRAMRRVAARGIHREVPSYRYDGHTIWGATAMIIAELLDVATASPS